MEHICSIRNTCNRDFPMSVDIGGRLRFIRARHKLSQRELAKRSGVTNSTISLIESNQMNPSVGALKRILDGLPMGLAEFFAIEPERPRKAFYRSDELTEIGKQPISYRQVGDNLFGRALQILKERYEPGSDTGRVPLFRKPPASPLPLRRRQGVRSDQRLHAADVLNSEAYTPSFRCCAVTLPRKRTPEMPTGMSGSDQMRPWSPREVEA
jgi:transcriptional regulator with XRE-family HTH domain